MMKLHNTLTQKTEVFTPLTSEKVSLYTCGPTVYDYQHVGNWVAFMRWDILVRVLKLHNYTVDRVMNITDVGHLVSDADEGEDKMEKGAKREGKNAWEIATFYTTDFLEGMQSLNMLPPEHMTRATDYIEQQIALIKRLQDKGHTYLIDDGVYFDTSTFPTYADFAHLDLAAQKAGARVEFNGQKRHHSDFALWKLTPEGQTRDMEWDSPWGRGFPGWHLECSAMALNLLGDTIDIHTGGIDHIPVHHTNEIAQSQAATGKPFARYWLHADFLTVNGTKISKSLGNGYTLHDLETKGFSPIDFRMFILQSHYRSESNFTWDNLTSAHNRLTHWQAIAERRWQAYDTLVDDTQKDNDQAYTSLWAASSAIVEAVSDDLDTPAALTLIDQAFSRIEQSPLKRIHQEAFVAFISRIDELLGLRLLDTTPDITDEQKQLILARQRARERQDWPAADRARATLLEADIVISDTPHGPIWSRQS